MTQEIMNIQGIDCYEENGVAYLKLETVARGLGFTQEKNGVEYVKWERVNGYLAELGFSPEVGKGTYIPENIFYRLAMKAKNETAEQFQALIADEVIPQIRKTGGYQSKPLSPLELFAQSVAAMQAMEEKQKALEGRQDTVEKKVASIGEIVALNPNDWRRECKQMIVRVAEKLGGMNYIRDVQSEIYKLMNQLAAQGKAVILISSELPEVLGMSDRVLVVKDDAIVAELTGDKINAVEVMRYAL